MLAPSLTCACVINIDKCDDLYGATVLRYLPDMVATDVVVVVPTTNEIVLEKRIWLTTFQFHRHITASYSKIIQTDYLLQQQQQQQVKQRARREVFIISSFINIIVSLNMGSEQLLAQLLVYA